MIEPMALRALLAVQQHGSVVAAADALDFTASAISQQIKRLERQQGATLLERVGRGVVLTDVGRVLADRGSRVLDELEALENLARDPRRPAGPFRLASFATANRGLVTPLLARLAADAPEVRPTVIEGEPRDIVVQVARGRADAGLVHDWESIHLDVPAGVETDVLLVDRADLIVHRGHRFAERAEVTPRDLVQEPWVSTPPGTICHDWLIRMFARHALQPDIRFVDPEYASHLAFARHGIAVALVPRLGRGPLPEEVVAVPVGDPVPSRRIQLIWRSAATDNPARHLVHEALREIAGSPTVR